MKGKVDGFVLAIMAVVLAAYLFPQGGGRDSVLPLDLIGSIGVSLIFFFYGLKLSPERIRSGLKNWRLHVLVQCATFLLFPLIVLVFYPFIQSDEGRTVWLAFLFLAVLPSTVSSSVVMVSIARGNIPAAIFNASISGLIGIAVTPLWMGFFLERAAGDFDLGSIYVKLLTEILAPVILGLALQRYLGGYVQRYSRGLNRFDKAVILLIIYKSFAESFEEGIFGSVSWWSLLAISVGVLALFYTVYFITGALAERLGFDREDRITAQFCGTKKSLVHGTVFSKILFPASIPVGLVLLPLMLFHAIQIFIISIIAGKQAKDESTGTQ